MNSKPIQAGGINHVWRNPKNSFRHPFLKLNLNCKLDNHPGVVIVSNVNYQQAFASQVNSLEKELPQLLQSVQGQAVAYWWLEHEVNEQNRIYSGITEHPVFVG